MGVDFQPRVGFHKKRAAIRKIRVLLAHKVPKLIGILKQVDVDRFFGRRIRKLTPQVFPSGRQFVQEPMPSRNLKVAMDHELIAHNRVAIRQVELLVGPRPGAARSAKGMPKGTSAQRIDRRQSKDVATLKG